MQLLKIIIFLLVSIQASANGLCGWLINPPDEAQIAWLRERYLPNITEVMRFVRKHETQIAGFHAGPSSSLKLLLENKKTPTDGSHRGNFFIAPIPRDINGASIRWLATRLKDYARQHDRAVQWNDGSQGSGLVYLISAESFNRFGVSPRKSDYEIEFPTGSGMPMDLIMGVYPIGKHEKQLFVFLLGKTTLPPKEYDPIDSIRLLHGGSK